MAAGPTSPCVSRGRWENWQTPVTLRSYLRRISFLPRRAFALAVLAATCTQVSPRASRTHTSASTGRARKSASRSPHEGSCCERGALVRPWDASALVADASVPAQHHLQGCVALPADYGSRSVCRHAARARPDPRPGGVRSHVHGGMGRKHCSADSNNHNSESHHSKHNSTVQLAAPPQREHPLHLEQDSPHINSTSSQPRLMRRRQHRLLLQRWRRPWAPRSRVRPGPRPDAGTHCGPRDRRMPRRSLRWWCCAGTLHVPRESRGIPRVDHCPPLPPVDRRV